MSRTQGLLLMVLVLIGCVDRKDDALEPNDTLALATNLSLDQAVSGRVNQGNDDVFCIAVQQSGTLSFVFESVGLEDCTTFELHGPASEPLYVQRRTICSQPREVVISGEATFEVLAKGYALRTEATRVGQYCVTVREAGMADNVLPLSWDYTLTASLK